MWTYVPESHSEANYWLSITDTLDNQQTYTFNTQQGRVKEFWGLHVE